MTPTSDSKHELPIFMITNEETGLMFCARLLRLGARFGPKNRAVHDDPEPVIEIGYLGTVDAPKGSPSSFGAEYYLKTLEEHDSALGICLDGGNPSMTISAQNVRQILDWAHKQMRVPWNPPPLPPRPASQLLARTPRTPLAEAGDRKVTIYSSQAHPLGFIVGIMPIEARWVEVRRVPYAQYEDAYHIRYLPRGGRKERKFYEAGDINLVILLGWGHPSFVQNFKPSEDMDNSLEEFKLVKNVPLDEQKEDFEDNFSRYLQGLEPPYVLCDLRGERSTRRTSPYIKDAPGTIVLSRTGEQPGLMSAKLRGTEASVVFISYFHARDSALRAELESKFASLYHNTSVFIGEESSSISDRVLKSRIRPRIAASDAVVVLLGGETDTRRWVDWEIRTGLDANLPGGPRPLVGVLSPEFDTSWTELVELCSWLPPMDSPGIRKLTDSFYDSMRKNSGVGLPKRFLDNLFSGYANLVLWPGTDEEIHSLLNASRRIRRPGVVVNSRPLMIENL